VGLIREAAEKPRVRHRTRPTPASREQRLEVKHRRSRTKDLRRHTSEEVD
jgi:hypothetical protein